MSSRPRIRKRPVTFGNPALGTYRGTVFTNEGGGGGGHYSTTQAPLVEGALPVERLVAMVNVPPEQVPEGILNLIRAHRPLVEHVRIVIAEHVDALSSEVVLCDVEVEDTIEAPAPAAASLSYTIPLSRHVSAAESAASILAAEHDVVTTQAANMSEIHQLQDSERTYLVLIEVSDPETAVQMVQELNGLPYTFLDETQVCSMYHVVAWQGMDGVSLMSPFFAPSAKATKDGLEIIANDSSDDAADATPSNLYSDEHFNCAVCLERMELSRTTGGERNSVLTTVCNHSFHLECLMQWQDSPCPVCRYDHSGLNHALSQCNVCGTTENNYVCLICGVVSCGGGMHRAAALGGDDACRNEEKGVDEGEISSPSSSHQGLATSHARKHYDETLHAYALDTDTQHVWDFAGQGYVHRLLQNKEDGKLVEVHNPSNTSHARSLSPGLSEAQEGEVVHRKLEGFASQYYTLLKSQLEQQRIYYEGRLEEIRREYQGQKPPKRPIDMIAALKQERNQLSQRLLSLQTRKTKMKEDVGFLKSMNESLQANKAPLQRQIENAQRERLDCRYDDVLPQLHDQVTRLMLQLEASGQTDQERKPAARGG